jgi:uncharacterized Fe-S cluster-containing radical SAM superfamily protein
MYILLGALESGLPAEAFRQFSRIGRKAQVSQLRISGAEPTLGKSHLLGLLEKVENSPFRLFILETKVNLVNRSKRFLHEGS